MACRCHEGISIMKMFLEPNDIYLHSGFVDFRKSINGLLVIIEYELELSPFNDALFILCNKKQDKLKIVYWVNTGDRVETSRFGTMCCKRIGLNGLH
jgi:transposase